VNHSIFLKKIVACCFCEGEIVEKAINNGGNTIVEGLVTNLEEKCKFIILFRGVSILLMQYSLRRESAGSFKFGIGKPGWKKFLP
jgi:hypothetical protein